MSDQAQNSAQALTPYQQHRVQVRDSMAAGVAEPMAIVPRTYGELSELCQALASSTLVPQALRERAPNIMVILMNGAELGMPPMQALRLHHVIEGVPRLSAEGMAAVVTRSPVCEYFECVSSDETKSVWRTKRLGRQEQTMTWTIERAKRAGLAGKTTWQQHPGPMLNSRCKAELARMVYPDVVAGMITAEEARDGDDFAEPPTRGSDFEAPAAPGPSAPAAKSPAAAPAPAKPKAEKPKGRVVEATATERQAAPAAAPAPANPPAAAGAPPAQSASPPKNASAPSAASASSPAPSSSSAPAGSSSDPTPPSSASPPRSATEGSSATSGQDAPPSESTAQPSSFAADDLGGDDLDSGFGGDEPEPEAEAEAEPADEVQLEPPTSITQFSSELIGLVAKLRTEPIAATKATELGLLKSRWMAWSEARVKEGKDGHADVKRMRGEFSAAVAELGLR